MEDMIIVTHEFSRILPDYDNNDQSILLDIDIV
jgi:hypothetical protein